MEILVILGVIYLFPCFVVAYVASSKGRSAFGFFLLSLITTPLLGGAVVLIMPMTVKKMVERELEKERLLAKHRPKTPVRQLTIEHEE